MTTRRIHIIGAGVAGLSAALAFKPGDGAVILYEAAPQAGGRCRTLPVSQGFAASQGFAHDNGAHVLFTANRHALALLKAVGARHRWIEPERKGLPLYDLPTGQMRQVGLSPLSWLLPSRRPHGLHMRDMANLLRLVFSSEDRPVASFIGSRPILESLVEPLTVAVLNTPVACASSQRLARVLRRLLRPGAGRLLVAQEGLSADLIEPALAALQARGVSVLTSQRLRAIPTNGSRAIGLSLTDRTVALGPEDRVILALPPWEIERLLPGLGVPQAYEPILNLHYSLPGPDRPRFIGLTGSLAQWMLVRRDHVSVTVSAAGQAVDRDAGDLAAQVWREIVPALHAIGIGASAEIMPDMRVVKEKRATIRQAAVPLPQPPLRPLLNLALAGDWIGVLPATIESAVMAGEHAAAILREGSPAHTSFSRPVTRENAA
jgi:predicted NAD/FAD-dependent oxidoreductase